ncbi:hypothetical protein J5U23_02097 [Saccharolobus shibatae B12]|uniref:Uncharacterized protein n=2 Tax=Saccharolobus shibatae TaxID=2286 RepID=A0A8F5BQ38_SACSH|nr:hypothetical protein J5U23_02097 [Saccharolobus shibatae B12]QXJ35606.1 hypothetical protein J5U22_02153 [Saccharolobus shibatae]
MLFFSYFLVDVRKMKKEYFNFMEIQIESFPFDIYYHI